MSHCLLFHSNSFNERDPNAAFNEFRFKLETQTPCLTNCRIQWQWQWQFRNCNCKLSQRSHVHESYNDNNNDNNNNRNVSNESNNDDVQVDRHSTINNSAQRLRVAF